MIKCGTRLTCRTIEACGKVYFTTIRINTIKLRSVSGAGGDARLKTSLENAIKYAKQQLEVAERTLKENQTKLRNLS